MDTIVNVIVQPVTSSPHFIVVSIILVVPVYYIGRMTFNGIKGLVITKETLKIDTFNQEESALGEATQRLLNTACLREEVAVDTLTKFFWDVTPDSPQDGLVEGALNHYKLVPDDYTVLSNHAERIYEFNTLLHSQFFESTTNLALWTQNNSPYLFKVYSLICGVIPGL